VALYEKTIQSAFREVADALAARTTLEEQLEAKARWSQPSKDVMAWPTCVTAMASRVTSPCLRATGPLFRATTNSPVAPRGLSNLNHALQGAGRRLGQGTIIPCEAMISPSAQTITYEH